MHVGRGGLPDNIFWGVESFSSMVKIFSKGVEKFSVRVK